ncbi:putative AfsR family transcriptional regulator [Kitasatospora setae KM-6054]|uniref:Putative AfsR family transcriptional regulator n=1 Tax=Kitasatospora setae (strain ATCC 33774 / DSM 43861 / JCM 3304 / KCC A-0304 / NBRC 14216 / KM-6054) TaxID=452652 RepID=E4N6C1_KITSK|nr:putative AfsR family transcriptional regulator [Kitasatospora setae KM-6054]
MLFFRILGPLEIGAPGDAWQPNGGRQAILLSSLLVSDGHFMTTEALVDEIWGDSPPSGALNALQAQVSRLRRRLSSLSSGSVRLAALSGGYLLDIRSRDLDASVFTEGLERVRTKAAGGTLHSSEVADLLKLWRGPVLGGLTGGSVCAAATIRYEELRLHALEFRYECEIDEGGRPDIIAELKGLVAAHPYRERFLVQLVVALCRVGRQADALHACRRHRAVLLQDLGIDPSPTVRKLEHAILHQDPAMFRAR